LLELEAKTDKAFIITFIIVFIFSVVVNFF